MPKFSGPIEMPSGRFVLEGTVEPEGAITAPPGSIYLRTNGAVSRKASGVGNTGWIGLACIVAITQANYDALQTKDAYTIYAVPE